MKELMIKCSVCKELLEPVSENFDLDYHRITAMCPKCGLTTLSKLKEPEFKNYIVETDGDYGDPELFFVITAKNEKEAKVMVECEISDKSYNCRITKVKLLDVKKEGVKATAFSCC